MSSFVRFFNTDFRSLCLGSLEADLRIGLGRTGAGLLLHSSQRGEERHTICEHACGRAPEPACIGGLPMPGRRWRQGELWGRRSNSPRATLRCMRDGLCISGIIKNCSWNQPTQSAQFSRTANAATLCMPPFLRAPSRGVPASKPLSQRGAA
jgi:hypothetical protein